MVTDITPYLMFNNNCEEALQFYSEALGGIVKHMSRVNESPKEFQSPGNLDKIMHAEMMIGKASFMASDSMGKNMVPGTNTHISLNFESIEEINISWKNMCEGATVTMDLQDTFWGAKFGMLQDKFGINWMFNCDKK